jgi:hypothetical protein
MVKLFTSGEIDMAKVVIDMGYKSYVMDAEQGIALMDALSKAEVYEEKYHREEAGNVSHYTYHVYPLDSRSGINMKLLGAEAYKMYKMAGKPND